MRRAYLQTFLLLLTSLVLLGTAIASYALFYNTCIPQKVVSKTVHLQFPPATSHPSASIAFAPLELARDQPYVVTLHLVLPPSPPNLAQGNFNCELLVKAAGGRRVLSERRPALMTYASPLARTLRTLVASPLLVAGWAREQEALAVVLAEAAVFSDEPHEARVDIDARIAIYHARLEFSARLSGLRWLMYHWRLPTALAMIGLFWGTELVYAALVWYWVSSWLGMGGDEEVQVKKEDDGGDKDAGEDGGRDGEGGDGEEREQVRMQPVGRFGYTDVQRTFPTSSRAPPLVPGYPSPESTERGWGGEGIWTPNSGEESRAGDDEGDDYNEEYERLAEAGAITAAADSGLGTTTLSESTGRDTGGSRRRRG